MSYFFGKDQKRISELKIDFDDIDRKPDTYDTPNVGPNTSTKNFRKEDLRRKLGYT